MCLPIYLGFPGGSDGRECVCNARDQSLIPRSGRLSGEGNGNPLQYSFLENPLDRGAWRATVQGVAKIRTWLILYLIKLDLSWWLGELAILLLKLMPLVEAAVWVLAPLTEGESPPHQQECILWASDAVAAPPLLCRNCLLVTGWRGPRCLGVGWPFSRAQAVWFGIALGRGLTRASSGATVSWALRQMPLSSRAARRQSSTLILYPLVFYWPVHLLLWPDILRITVTEPSEFRQPVTCIQTS